MKKNTLFSLLLLLFLPVLSYAQGLGIYGIVAYEALVYRHNTKLVVISPNQPCFSSAGQRHLNIFPSGDHIEGQFAFSPKDHLGIYLNTYLPGPLSPLAASKGTIMGEGACGYYHSIGSSTKWFVDGYAGLGLGQRLYKHGSSYSIDFMDDCDLSSWYEKMFFQASIYVKKDKNQFALGVEEAFYHYNALHFHYKGTSKFLSNGDLDLHRYNVSLWSPTMTLKHQFKRAIFITQFICNMGDVGRLSSFGSPFVRRVSINCGLQYVLGKKGKQAPVGAN